MNGRYAPARGKDLNVALRDGVSLYVKEVGSGFPLMILHGGPGLDHTHLSPYFDPLGDEFRVLYVDERGQGRSERVDPATLSLEVFAHDVDQLAEALELDEFALLGHSFGAIVTTWHAINLSTAARYVISGGGDASEKLMADVEASLEKMGAAGVPIAESWEREKSVESDEDVHDVLRDQAPFHFAGKPPPGFGEETSPARRSCATSPTTATATSTTRLTWAASRRRRSSSSASSTA